MEAVRPSPNRATRRRSLVESVAVGALVAVTALSLPIVNLIAPFVGGAVAGHRWGGGAVEGGIVGTATGLAMVVPASAVSVLLDVAGVRFTTLAPGAAPLLDLVVVAPSGLVGYRVSAFALLAFGVLFGLSGGIIGGSANDALA